MIIGNYKGFDYVAFIDPDLEKILGTKIPLEFHIVQDMICIGTGSIGATEFNIAMIRETVHSAIDQMIEQSDSGAMGGNLEGMISFETDKKRKNMKKNVQFSGQLAVDPMESRAEAAIMKYVTNQLEETESGKAILKKINPVTGKIEELTDDEMSFLKEKIKEIINK